MFTALCSAMESKKQLQQYENHWLNNTQEITTVKKPWSVEYFTKKHVAISGADGDVYSVNLKTQEIQKIIGHDSYRRVDAILQSKNKKMIICNGIEVAVYDAKEMSVLLRCKLKNERIGSFAWNGLKDSFFLCCKNKKVIKRLNYVTGKYEDIDIQDQICELMTMHPTKEILCIADSSGNISLYNIDGIFSKIKTIDHATDYSECLWCKYSLDGSCIVAGNNKQLVIIDPNKNAYEFILVNAARGEAFRNIVLHPNGSILAILCNYDIKLSDYVFKEKKHVIYYYNMKTQKFIGVTPKLIFGSQYDSSYGLSFSDDGSELIIVLDKKCVRMHVPFAIKEKCLYSLCVLNRIKDYSKWPNDIVQYCANMLLESFKF